MSKKHYREINKCRICGNPDLTEVLNFGSQYLASSFVKTNAGNELSKTKIPLTVVLCDRSKNDKACGLVQLRETAERDLMYRSYFYRSGTNPMMREALQNIVSEVKSKVELKPGDAVLDIGCNDGTMLSYYPDFTERIGIDPAENIDRSALDQSIKVAADYFSKNKALELSGGKQFKVITSIAMFYDLDDPNAFVADAKAALAPGGVWCVQLSYLPTSLATLNFYDVCHEHLEYYTLRVLESLMARHGLKIFDASLNEVNGGSLRIFVANENDARPVSATLQGFYKKEDALNLFSTEPYQEFGKKVAELKKITLDYIAEKKNNGGSVIGLGASTKGNVLLQFFGIDKQMVPHLSERNPEKVGLRTLGTDIELISEEKARELQPSAMLVLIWFFKDELLKREKDYLAKGGSLMFPMPYPHVVTKNGEKRLYSV